MSQERPDPVQGKYLGVPDPLSKAEREVLGRAVRLHIPLRDVHDLKRMGEIIKTLGARLVRLSKSRDPEMVALSVARFEIKLIQDQLNEKPK